MDYLQEQEDKEPLHRRAYERSRFLFDLVRAIFYLVMAALIFNRNAPEGLGITNSFIKMFSCVIAIYGLFRLWRAWYYSPLNKNNNL
jgi:hypothetical protein